jgi:hypothetical protein
MLRSLPGWRVATTTHSQREPSASTARVLTKTTDSGSKKGDVTSHSWRGWRESGMCEGGGGAGADLAAGLAKAGSTNHGCESDEEADVDCVGGSSSTSCSRSSERGEKGLRRGNARAGVMDRDRVLNRVLDGEAQIFRQVAKRRETDMVGGEQRKRIRSSCFIASTCFFDPSHNADRKTSDRLCSPDRCSSKWPCSRGV